MKKTLPALVLLSILVFLFLPVVTSAQLPATECKMKRTITLKEFTCAEGEQISLEDPKAICCALQAIYNVTDWIFVFLVALATVFVIIGALLLLFAAGSTEKIATGRNYIIYAAIGLGVGFLAKAIPGIVKLVVGIT